MRNNFIKNYIGNAGTRNAIERELWVKSALAKLPAGSRILDAGAGEQRYSTYCSHLNYVSQDFCEYEGEGNKQGLQTGTWDLSKIDIVSDIINIPEPDASFDAILCTEVLEHIPDPIAALGELYRLLRPGGELILSAPFASLIHLAPYHYYSGFNRYFYEHHLPKIGFTINEIATNGNYSEYVAQELRRLLMYYGKAPFYAKTCIAVILSYIKIKRNQNNIIDLGCLGFHIRALKKHR
jgi:ubiquinone/menaquinone biosynthesis C-methylase UbiE